MKVTEVGERVVRGETDFLTLLPPVGGISLSLSFTASKKEERRRKGGGWGGKREEEDLWNGPEEEFSVDKQAK